MPDVANVPLNALVALHLLSRDMLSMTQGVSIKTLDTGEEYLASLDLPADLASHLEKLKKDFPRELAIICRMVARSVYLASDLPLAVLEPDPDHLQNPFPLASVVTAMDVLEELEAVCAEKGEELQRLLYEPVPASLKYWDAFNPGHVIAAVKEYRRCWSQIHDAHMAPSKARPAGTVPDPAVAGGMAKGLASSWRQPRLGRSSRPRKAKRISGLDEAC